MSEINSLMELIDRLDVPTLALGCIYGFWRITKLLHAIELRLSKIDSLLEFQDTLRQATNIQLLQKKQS